MIESLVLTQDHDGNYHFYAQPYKISVDIQRLPFGKWLKLEEGKGRITIELDGRTVVYDRVGFTLDGDWVCILRLGGANAESA